jgi:hypothetical protein
VLDQKINVDHDAVCSTGVPTRALCCLPRSSCTAPALRAVLGDQLLRRRSRSAWDVESLSLMTLTPLLYAAPEHRFIATTCTCAYIQWCEYRHGYRLSTVVQATAATCVLKCVGWMLNFRRTPDPASGAVLDCHDSHTNMVTKICTPSRPVTQLSFDDHATKVGCPAGAGCTRM